MVEIQSMFQHLFFHQCSFPITKFPSFPPIPPFYVCIYFFNFLLTHHEIQIKMLLMSEFQSMFQQPSLHQCSFPTTNFPSSLLSLPHAHPIHFPLSFSFQAPWFAILLLKMYHEYRFAIFYSTQFLSKVMDISNYCHSGSFTDLTALTHSFLLFLGKHLLCLIMYQAQKHSILN